MENNLTFDIVRSKSIPKNLTVKKYSKQSIYCDLSFGKKKLAVSLNLEKDSIFIYWRDKSSIDMIVGFLDSTDEANIFIMSKNILASSVLNLELSEKIDLYIYYLSLLNQYFIDCQEVQKKRLIKGNSNDILGNVIVSPENLLSCYIQFKGHNNRVTIHPNANLKNMFILFSGNNSSIEIGERVSLKGKIVLGYNSKVVIGNSVTSTNKVYMTCFEGTSIDIGDDCMFATDNQVRTDDAHAIYSTETGDRINYSQNIRIGKHVWIGYGAVILGGSSIGDGSVVGMNSLVNKQHPNNCVIVGTPAKIVRKNIFWQRPNVRNFDEHHGLKVKNFQELSYCNNTIEVADSD